MVSRSMGYGVKKAFSTPNLERAKKADKEMSNSIKVLLVIVLIAFLTGSVQAGHPVGDLDGNYEVGLKDLQIFASQWLDPSGCAGLDCADFDGENGVNLADFALMTKKWKAKFLLITEFMASNDETIEDPEEPGEFPDWFEIYNAGDETIDLSGMHLTDNPNDPTEWQIPNGITIEPNDYIIFWADDEDDQGDRHTNFKLGADGDDVFLFASDGSTLIDGISFDRQYSDISYGRYPETTNTWRFMGNPTPGWQNDPGYIGQVADTKFSVDRGFYDEPFQVRIATDTEDATIRYTLNGQDPIDPNGSIYDPNSPIQVTGTTCLRAAAYKPGWMPSNIDTQTYIFLSNIINQPSTAPGPGWPSTSINGQVFDYEMDPDVTSNPDYNDLIDDALLAIPSICLTTDLENLFDPTVGIYVNCGWYGHPGWERGKAWERPVSVELINPDGSEGFQINAGLRMRGITSCQDSNPKHAFRLFFENEYDGPLNYPLFGDEGADQFERMDLRCEQNYSWSMDGNPSNTLVREVFSRDLQRETNQPYSRSRYYHLYINGVYWGLYQTQERAEASFGKIYFGGDNDDYDVVKSNRSWPRSVECIDGNFDAYERLWLACQDGFDTDEAYYHIQGRDTNGDPNHAYERLVDVDNLIDYMLTIFYTGDFDAPISGWYSNRIPNNFFGVYNRVNPDGFKYFRHDGEHTMWSTGENRTGPYNDPWLMNFIRNCPEANDAWPDYTCVGFNPQTVHQYLTVHPEYKMKFADHVHRCFFNDAPMTVEGAQQLFAARAAEIDLAIIAESARWGDAKSSSPFTKNHWLSAIAWVLDTYMPVRSANVLNQLRSKGWYPNVDAPEFKVNGTPQHGGYIESTDSISITSSAGTIYYTKDGSDPRVSTSPGEFTTVTLVPENAPKKVFVPDSNIGTTWRGGSEPYDDSLWTHGTPIIPDKTGGVGYDIDPDYDPYITYDVQSQMYGIMPSCYVRIPFTVDAKDLATFNYMTLRVRCDDGFVAFINNNDVEVTSINKPDPFVWNSSCDNRPDSTAFVDLPVTDHLSALQAGDNILAIHAMNQSSGSSDFLISAELIAGEDTSNPGGVSPTAIEYTGPFTLDHTTNLKARILDGDTWSALSDAIFAIDPVVDNLRITEIMYHPQDTNDPNDPNEEFIELKNIGPETINLNLVRFTNGIDFTFPDVNLAPAQHIVVVKDINLFEDKYGSGINVAGQYTGRLANEGERIRLEDALGTTILDFRYRDGWRSNTDGDGYSLTIVNPLNPDPNSWSEKDSWRPSAHIDGSPGGDDSGIIPNPSDVVINEVLAHSDGYPNDWIELHNTTGSSINITGWFLSDDDANLTKYEIPDTTIPPDGYVVFTQDDHFGSYFALSEHGEMVRLTSKRDPNGNLTGYRQKEDFGASENGVAFGRYYKVSTDNYNFVPMSINTPGLSFEGAPNAYPKVGPVVIREIMYHPEMFWGHWDAEYIELYNITGSTVNLYDANGIPWKFTDGIEFTFPPGISIPAHKFLLVVREIAAFNSEFTKPGGVQMFEWESGRLDNDGEKVEISMPGDIDDNGQRQYIRIDRVNYSNGSHPENFDGVTDPWPIEADGTGQSLERINVNLYGNDPNNWQAATPSPGQ